MNAIRAMPRADVRSCGVTIFLMYLMIFIIEQDLQSDIQSNSEGAGHGEQVAAAMVRWVISSSFRICTQPVGTGVSVLSSYIHLEVGKLQPLQYISGNWV